MNALIIDTTTVDLIVIVVKGDKVFNGSVKNAKTAHSELLCTVVQETMQNSDMRFNDLDVYACAIGPGSFTGIRIGVSTVKGYNRACKKLLIAIDNLNILSFSHGNQTNASIIDAGNGWYYGEYCGCECVSVPQLIPYESDMAKHAVNCIKGDVVDAYVNYVKTMFEQGKFVEDLVPMYIRKSQAEVAQDNEH